MLKISQKVFEYELPIKITPQKDGCFVVTSPVWEDCYAQGDSIDEAILEVTAVAQSLVELYKEEGLKIPLKIQDRKDNIGSLITLPVIVSAT